MELKEVLLKRRSIRKFREQEVSNELIDELLKSAKERAVQARCVQPGDIVVQTAGIMTCVSGSNMLVVSEIE